jgi:hypothetical protein
MLLHGIDDTPIIRWTKTNDDEPGRVWHERVSYTKKITGFIPMWRDHKQTPLAEATTLGYFLLFMKDLERERYISCEMQRRDRTLMYRLRLVHHTGAFWIQTAKEWSQPLRLVA